MKIKLAILEKDTNYLKRLVTAFNTKYADKFEIYSFTDAKIAISAINESKIDVFVANDFFDIPFDEIPARCAFAYFVDSVDVQSVNDKRAISKFQKAELIYKQILSLYSENAGAITGLTMLEDDCKLIAFTSVSGGTGSSVMAAACSKYFASKGKRTLYLNLEKFGSADLFFSAEGQFNMSDIIYALKSKKANLTLKLESCVKQDSSGVCFYSQSPMALDMTELSIDEIRRLISEIKLTGSYDYIVVDTDFDIDNKTLEIFRQMHSVVVVGDGSEISNAKTLRAYNAINVIDSNADSPIINRMCLIYNKFSNKTSLSIENLDLKNIGGVPRFEHATTKQVLDQLSTNAMFEKIL
mgnify:CR=1 FL=1